MMRSGDEAILVDAGPPSLEWCADNTQPVRDATERQLHEALARHGIAPRAVRTVVLTHLHWDHCGGLGLFEHAQILIQQRERGYAADPLWVHERPFRYAHEFLLHQSPLSAAVPLDGDTTLRRASGFWPPPAIPQGRRSSSSAQAAAAPSSPATRSVEANGPARTAASSRAASSSASTSTSRPWPASLTCRARSSPATSPPSRPTSPLPCIDRPVRCAMRSAISAWQAQGHQGRKRTRGWQVQPLRDYGPSGRSGLGHPTRVPWPVAYMTASLVDRFVGQLTQPPSRSWWSSASASPVASRTPACARPASVAGPLR